MVERRIILFDLDGTLADCSHRLHYIKGLDKNWDAFHLACINDAPIKHMIDLYKSISEHMFECWIVTGRSEMARKATEWWLGEQLIEPDRLIMRPEKDYTEDTILKIRWLEDGTIPKERVAFALEDRYRVVKAWRDAGIPCLQVTDGDF
jgi:FMN phosphatase YigB (HAD superfamily)